MERLHGDIRDFNNRSFMILNEKGQYYAVK